MRLLENECEPRAFAKPSALLTSKRRLGLKRLSPSPFVWLHVAALSAHTSVASRRWTMKADSDAKADRVWFVTGASNGFGQTVN
jgi:hypothetical protein